MIISNISELPESSLILPSDFVVPEKRPKKAPCPVDFNDLTEEQLKAAEMIMDYVEGKTQWRMIALKGYAGTGKTYTISKLENWMLYAKKFKIAVTAPTNKAVQVLKGMSDIVDSKLIFSTLHSLLGLKEKYDYNGRLHFVPDPSNPPSLSGYNVLIVDETSMLDDSLFMMIESFVEEGLKIIFVGDPAQIPPINRIDAIPFLKARQIKYHIGVCELTQIRRQALDNPLLHFANEIREQRTKNEFSYDYKPVTLNGAGIIPIKRESFDVIYKICDVYFNNPIFSEYPDFMKVVAWRNKTVDAINAKVRSLIYKQDNLPKVMVGEKMLADEAIKEGSQIILTTNSEFIVKRFDIKSTWYVGSINNQVIVRNDFKYYETVVEHLTDRGPKEKTIRIIHEDSELEFNKALDLFVTFINKLSGFDRTGGWREYYKFKSLFAAVKYNYAITAHKSQGSTYENCMMIEWDMYENTRYEERNRIRYVAATRARNHLFIVK